MNGDKKKVRLEDMLPVIVQKLESGGEVTIPVTGTSMNPMLLQGRDYAVLRSAPGHLNKNDIPFYRRDNGQFVLHRVVGEDENGYIMRGDNQTVNEYGVRHGQIIGILVAVERDGKRIPVESIKFMPNNSFHTQINFFRRAKAGVKKRIGKAFHGKKEK